MIDYSGLKTIFGEKLPEPHIFFATVAAHKYVPSYAFLRRELGLSSAHTNRKVWKKFVEAYGKAVPPAPPAPPLTLSKDLTASMSVEEGAALTLSVTATGGTGPYTYAWTKDGSPIPGASGATYTKPTAAAEDSGVYKVTITDSKKVSKDSTACTVTVNPGVGG
ncbi:putative tail protein [Escherichia phage vB_EcoS_ESCO30]|uniref:Tail protein n=1 Tax=Escherichia phage vB_EcoS_ESCO30 TaxID=2918879 RepID=A0AAE9HMY1_9CAUD|nr:putative tail protein [Escherichia phage vB_EcoS_ESCO30]